MKIVKLIRAKGVIMPFAKEKLSPKLSYKLMKFISKIEVEEAFYNKSIDDLINKYGERDDNDRLIQTETSVKIKEEHRQECDAELQELDNVDVDSPGITFTLDELNEIKLSAQDMFFLQDFIEE